jgi:hypothetical protein
VIMQKNLAELDAETPVVALSKPKVTEWTVFEAVLLWKILMAHKAIQARACLLFGSRMLPTPQESIHI